MFNNGYNQATNNKKFSFLNSQPTNNVDGVMKINLPKYKLDCLNKHNIFSNIAISNDGLKIKTDKVSRVDDIKKDSYDYHLFDKKIQQTGGVLSVTKNGKFDNAKFIISERKMFGDGQFKFDYRATFGMNNKYTFSHGLEYYNKKYNNITTY